MAKEIGVSRHTLYRYEWGDDGPLLETAVRMARACGFKLLVVPVEEVDLPRERSRFRAPRSHPETQPAQPFPCDSSEGTMLVYPLNLIYELSMRSSLSEIQQGSQYLG